MQHVFEFMIKPVEGDEQVHSFYTTKSARSGKVADMILKEINELRVKADLVPWQKGDLEVFKMKKHR